MLAELNQAFFGNPVLMSMTQWVITASLIFARVVSFLHLAPVFSDKGVTTMIRIRAVDTGGIGAERAPVIRKQRTHVPVR